MCESPKSTHIFKNSNHKTNTLDRIYTLYKQQRLCDVEIILKNHRFKAHSLVLLSVSKYFNYKLIDNSEIPSFKQISIDNLDNEATQRTIDYCYTGEIEFSSETVLNVLNAAGLFQLKPVVKSCCDFMAGIINTENCLKFDETLHFYGYPTLRKKVSDFITKNYIKISESEEFREISAERLQRFLHMNLSVSSEHDVCDIIKTWVTHDVPNRKNHLCHLLKLVKLPSLTDQITFDEVQPLCKSIPDCRHLLLNSLEWKHCPDKIITSSINWDKLRLHKYAIVVAGGCNSEATYTVDLYDPNLNTWWTYANSFITRRNVSYALIGDELIAMGGQDISAHNTVVSISIKTAIKTILPSLQVARSGAVAVSVGDVVYIFGGDDGTKTVNSVEKWDPKTRTWSLTTPMITGRRGCGIAVLDDEIYLIGGWNESAKDDVAYKIVEVFCPHSEKWRTCAPLNKARSWFSATTVDGKIYALGGRYKGDVNSEKIKTVECYSKNENSWSFSSDMSVARYGVAAGALDNSLVVLGGVNGGSSKRFELYDDQLKLWRPLASLSIPRENSFIFSVPTPFLEKKITLT